MGLSNDLISQFAKITNDNKVKQTESTVYGTVSILDGRPWVKIDGSDRLTPADTTTAVADGERVTILVKNHTATITGNVSSPAARNKDVSELSGKIDEFDTVIADTVKAETANIETAIITKLDGKYATFEGLDAKYASITSLDAAEADIDTLKADNVTINQKLTARDAEIDQLKADSLTVQVADAKYATIDNLTGTNAKLNNLESTYGEFKVATVDRLDAVEADIANLDVGKLDAKYASVTRLEAAEAEIDTLQANMLVADDLQALEANIANLQANKLSAKDADLKYATIAVLQSDYITADEIAATYITASAVAANYAKISTLESDYIKTTDLEANYITAAMINSKYAEIDLANVDRASIGTVLANIGLITSATIVDGHVTGYLDSVEVNANNITAGTLTVDRLIISGSDKSIIYAINNAGELTSTEADTINGDAITKRTIAADHIVAGAITANEIHSSAVTADKIATNAVTADKIAANAITSGKIAANAITADKIAADSITADKINVVDLKALGATIGTFKIGDNSIYSGTKSTVSNTSRGIYMDTDGQLNFGDANNYLKFYKDANNVYKLDIAAESLTFGSGTSVEEAINNVQTSVDNIQIGGRNLLLGSATKKITPYLETSATTEYGVEVPEWLTTEAIRTYGTGGTATIFGTMGGTSSQGASDNTRMYSATIYIKNNHATNSVTITGNHLSGVYVDVAPLEEKRVELVGLGNGWGYPQFNFKTAVAGNEFDITYWHPKIEIGNKPTDWTPAPEDVDAGISNAQTTAENAQTTAENAQSAANNASTTANNAQSTANAANTTANNAQNTANTASTNATNAVNTVNNMQIGGRNLYRESITTTWCSDLNGKSTTTRQTSTHGFTSTYLSGGGSNVRIQQLQFDGLNQATISYDAVVNTSTLSLTPDICDAYSSNKTVTVTTTKQRFTHTVSNIVNYNTSSMYNGFADFAFTLASGQTLTISNIKVEKGNKATDWSPAPEDVDAKIDATISKVDVMYAQNTSSTAAPTSGWTTTAPTWTDGKYIWTKTVTTYVSGTISESTPVCITGAKGATGNPGSPGSTGVGISSITELYYAGPSTTAPSAPTAAVTTNNTSTYVSWNKAMPTYSASYPHYFTCSQVYYTNDTYKWTTPVYAGALTSANATANNALNTANNIQVGGRNLFRQSGQWTALPTWWQSNGGGGISLDTTNKYLGHNTLSTTVGNGIVGANHGFIELDPNKTYTYSALIKSDTAYGGAATAPLHYHCSTDGTSNNSSITTIAYDQSLPVANTWKLLYLTFRPNGKYFRPFVYIGGGSRKFNIAYLKLEEGNKPTDWTPAPEDVAGDISSAQTTANNAQSTANTANNKVDNLQIGDKNLILNSGIPRSSTRYDVASYLLSEDWVPGQVYTLIVKGQHNSSYFGFYRDGGWSCAATISTSSSNNYIASKTFTCPAKSTSDTDSRNNVLTVYNQPNNVTHNSSISWIKLVKGNVKLTDWTPAPEDRVGQIDYSQGKMLHKDPMFKTSTNGCLVYNNAANGTVTLSRTTRSSDNPFTNSGYELTITNTGSASPYCGGFNQTFLSRANARFICRIIAKIPVGRNISYHSNAVGTGSYTLWHTSTAGTGQFEEYIIEIVCGSSGTFSSGGYYALTGAAGTTSAPIKWYVAFSACYDMTSDCDVIEASKTATNHMNFNSTDGLVVSQDATATGGNVQIKSDGFRIRNGTTVNASFLGNTITLGQNSASSSIKLCGDKGTIKVNENQFGRDALTIMAEDVELYSDVSTSMLCKPGVTSGGYSSTFSYCHTNYETFTLPNPITGTNLTFKYPIARLGARGINNSDDVEAMVEAGIGGVLIGGRLGSSDSALMVSGEQGIQACANGAPVHLAVYDSEIDPYIDIEPRTDTRGTRIYMAARNITLDPLDEVRVDGNMYYRKNSVDYKAFYAAGDTVQVVGSVAGCIIAEVTRIEFQLQLSKPIIGNPTITVSTAGGFVIRESGKYLYGCSGNGYTTDISKYVVVTRDDSGLLIQVYFNNSTNVSAINRPVSVGYNLNLTFS